MYYANRGLIFITITLLIVLFSTGAALIGYSQGKNTGYSQGSESIEQSSYTLGHDQGKSEGYEIGYEAGYESGVKETSSGYTSNDPSYAEMKEFLNGDTTNDRSYLTDEYICTDFSAEVNNNAEAAGIRCAVVYINYIDAGHAIVAFETTDRGLIFIEPQYDKEVQLIVGQSYSKLNGFVQQDIVDDTIQRYRVIW